MNYNSEEFKERVYCLMVGAFDLERYPIRESNYVANEYEEGKFCEKAYKEVYNANRRICQRLGVDEDRDVELIVSNLIDIGKYLSMKMYDYGVLFSSPSIK